MCIWKMLPMDGKALVYSNFFEAWNERAIFAGPETGRDAPENGAAEKHVRCVADMHPKKAGPLAQLVRAADS